VSVRKAAWVLFGMLFSTCAFAQPALSQSEATRMVVTDLMGPQCQFMPLGTYRVSADAPGVLQLAKKYESAGLVTITPVDESTGNVWSDLQKMGQSGLSALIKVEVSRTIDPSYFCQIGTSGKGLNAGSSSLKEVVRFEKVPGKVDGLPTDMYMIQALVDHQASAAEKLIAPDIQADQKLQVLFKYDYFKKTWLRTTSQSLNLSGTFNAAAFDRGRGLSP
jgi:hypothetical protein